jgi:hypothetical protein
MNPMPGGSIDNCITFQPVQNHVVIGDDSTIDFSKYYHFIAMPDLRVFANAGFPYSRMADLPTRWSWCHRRPRARATAGTAGVWRANRPGGH